MFEEVLSAISQSQINKTIIISRDESAFEISKKYNAVHIFEEKENGVNAAVSMADSTVPYDSYNNLPETQSVNTVNMGEGKTVVEIVNRDRISNYDYEVQVNENKRSIKIIKPEYYGQIIREFDNLTQIKQRTTYLRRLA